MKYGTWLAIYFVCWWVCLFTVLPFGVRSQLEDGHVVPGSDPGAPAKPRWLMILGLTSLLALVVFLVLWWLIQNYWMV